MNKRIILHAVSLLVLVLFLPIPPAWAQSGGDYDLTWSTVDGGGAVSMGGDYALGGAVGQPDAGVLSGGDLELSGGFWHITAVFVLNTYIITPAAGTGGSISPDTPQTVSHGDDITFTITPDTGYHVSDVTVDGSSVGAVNAYTFTNVITHHTLSATFALNEYTLTVNTVGNGSATRVPSQTIYLYGDVVTLTAAADPGWYFGQWSGDASGVLTQTTVKMDADKVVTATFVPTLPTYYTLTMSLVGSGVITPDVGTHQYLSGTVVSLRASPADGWQFDGWSGALESTANPAQVTMDADKVITATFSQPQPRCTVYLPLMLARNVSASR